MKNIKYNINFLIERKKILYSIMDSIEDKTWFEINQNIFSSIKTANLPISRDVISQIENKYEKH